MSVRAIRRPNSLGLASTNDLCENIHRGLLHIAPSLYHEHCRWSIILYHALETDGLEEGAREPGHERITERRAIALRVSVRGRDGLQRAPKIYPQKMFQTGESMHV